MTTHLHHLQHPTHLVIGGTGKTGRRVVTRLQEHRHAVISLSRPELDWADPATWASVDRVLTDARAAGRPVVSSYLTVAPDLTFPGAAEAAAEVARRLASQGVRRVVLLSGRGEAEAERAERLVADAVASYGASWAVVRCAFFMQNFDESLFVEPLAAGHVRFPAGTVGEPFVDADDIADVVTGLMLGGVAADRVHELTGPRLVTFAEATAAIAAATGRSISYEQVSTEAFVDDLVEVGLPLEDAAGLGALFAEVLDGRNAQVTDGVEAALGRQPRDFASYAAAAAGAGAWQREAAS